MQFFRSMVFNVLMYVWMGVLGIVFAPWAIASPRGARKACDVYARQTLWLLHRIVGLRTEVRGTPPTGQVLLAAKHQSFLDILLIWSAIPRGFFIMKSVLRYAPVLGQYALRLGCIPVHRGKRAEAVRRMLAEVRSGDRKGGQLLIYPQGTRVAPGARASYKVGTYALYEQLGQPCHPVATNVGIFWPRRGMLRRPGLGVVEFLEPIPPGLDRATFMALMEERIESGSNRLMEEAGFPVAPTAGLPGESVAAAAAKAAVRDGA
ncbi:lysophospholipid acyltransferase family protein [Jannaschia rubra]|uniref:2-acyl-glycerophospho-ethanolamine acyltransferase n=1 Tax=Jannaschia rubra TaxID=282197 RepID=A0A0M6XMI1_9RHOB|nr:lysophospholipid acyltransferase family protein [Jannaschia rubra]CTQ32289.1 2-acyl-glycerophospho-ethanolamine acyltransferase [Jannaschia rubra]SFG48038.1 1-acyl-sn-glycerol-3-phosphate acyltransferase [Jannaschia rubra]